MPLDLQPARPVALVCALMAPTADLLARAAEQLGTRLGRIRAASPVYAFDYTAYYQEEMGEGLCKQLVCFAEVVDPAVLPQVKRQTMELEREWSRREGGGQRRQVNIDPGLVARESLVLASTKYRGHRVCIAPGLYAEVTLLYQQGQYRPLEWTYPDFRSEVVQDFLQEVRAWLRAPRQRL